jgi:phosphate transport system substrate-binding protein
MKSIKKYLLICFLLNLPVFAQEIKCSGGDTMLPIFKSWISDFKSLNPKINLSIDETVNLSATGFDDFLENKINCVTFVREPFKSEIDRYISKNDHPPFLLPIALGSFNKKSATHAIAIYVNEQNPLNSIDLQQLDAIYSKSLARGFSKSIKKWGDLGLEGNWRDKPINAYSMLTARDSGNPPGIMNYLMNRVLLGGDFSESLQEIADSGSTQSLDLLVQHIKSDPYSIGFSGFRNQINGTKNLLISEGYKNPIRGTETTVSEYTYPLTRRIYLMFPSNKNGNLDPSIVQFIRYVLSERGQKIIANSNTSFIPLEEVQIKTAREVMSCEPSQSFFQYSPLALKASKKYITDKGLISIVGYNDMSHIITEWNRLFNFFYPGIFFENKLLSTRSAPDALLNEKSLFAPMGADFEPEALERFIKKNGAPPLTFAVSHNSLSSQALSGPIGILVHESSELDSIDLISLKQILSGLSNMNLVPYGLDETTALGKFMLEKLKLEKFSNSFQRFKQSRDVIAAAQKDPKGIAFSSAHLPHSGLKFLRISFDPSTQSVELNRENIENDLYPLDRTLNISVNLKDGKMDELTKKYLLLASSCVGQNQILKSKQAYIPLNSKRINRLIQEINSY